MTYVPMAMLALLSRQPATAGVIDGTTIVLLASDKGVVLASDGFSTESNRGIQGTDRRKVQQVTDVLIVGVAGEKQRYVGWKKP